MAQELNSGTAFIDDKPSPPAKMTYEEFLDWADEDTYAEWVNGEVILMSPATDVHQALVGFLGSLLQFFNEAHNCGVVRVAPFQMKTGPDLPGREPDVIFLTNEHLGRLTETHVKGPADIAVEIISRDSRARDRGEKFYEYEQGGVREYWPIDPLRKQAEFYRLGPDGIYQPIPAGEDGIFRSTVLEGFWLRVDCLWQKPLPPLMSMLKAWGLV